MGEQIPRFESEPNKGNQSEPNHEASDNVLNVGDQRAQMLLALYDYRAEHPGVVLDATTQNEALNAWIDDPDSKDTLAARYRTYIEAHPHALIDIDNESAVAVLLGNIRRTEGETLH